MIVYSIYSLLELANKNDEHYSFPFLESFFGSYSQKVTEDKKIPLFSKTTKYNNFPVRCQWKSEKKEDKNDEWRKEKSMVPTKIQKVSGIKGLACKVLNKITINNFEIQLTELLKVLCENKESMSVVIIANLILEKIWYDKSFYMLYLNLCKKLWENDDWVSESYKIFEKGKKYFYSLFSDENIKGPFTTYEYAEENAKKMSNFKSVFIGLCRDNFYKREQFINEMNHLDDSNKKYKLKRQIFGTIEILGYL